MNTISTQTIEAIISRAELLENINEFDKENLVLISISEPCDPGYNDEELSNRDVQDFKDEIRVKFWDIEENIGKYEIIPDRIAIQVQQFIMNNKNERFLIHCRAGQSRSAGVGKAVECIKFFGVGDEAKYNYQTGFNSEIDAHSRYFPNLTVFDKIVQDYE